MKVMILILAAQFVTAQLFAGANYFKGQQPVGIAGETTDCFLEADILTSGETAKLRVLAADPHDGDLIGLGPILAHYEIENAGYYFVSNNDHDKVQELFLSTQSPSILNSLQLTILDGNHADTLECKNLQTPQGLELELVVEKFKNFEDYTDDDHDHH